MTGMGRVDSLLTGRFRDAEFHWPLSGYEFEEVSVAIRPKAKVGGLEMRTFNNV